MANCLWCNKPTNANSKTIGEWEKATFWISTADKNSLICKECWERDYKAEKIRWGSLIPR